MSLLAPWFLFGVALIAGPIVAHLIRRATRQRFNFSALHFLEPSPPRLDRRSRIQNPWLLALRCLIVGLLAFGFARPFLRHDAPVLPTTAPARHVVAILDESASMRRTGLFDAARTMVRALAATLGPADEFVLLAAGNGVSELIGASPWLATPAGERAALVAATLSARSPGWGPTPLDSAAEAALARWEDMTEHAGSSGRRELVLISDFASGSRVSGLAHLVWPANAEVVLEPVNPAAVGNASLHWLGWSDPGQPNSAARVRVSRTFDSPETLTLRWHDARTHTPLGAAEPVTLLPGASEVRLVPMPAHAPAELELNLAGDAQDYDNHLWLVRPQPREIALTYFGAHAATDPQHARFYVERAIRGWREPIAHLTTDLPDGRDAAALVVVAGPMEGSQLNRLRARLEAGGFALVLLDTDVAIDTAAALAGETGWTARSSDRPDALLGQLDFQHPLFAPFADPLYSDFSRIRFWQPRPIALPAASKAAIVARFDDGSPAVLEVPVGAGRLIVWGGDWSPRASQWVLSSKFVPWLQALAERAVGGVGRPTIAELGDVSRLVSGRSPATWRRLGATSTTTAPSATPPTEPGLYELTQGNDRREVALLVPAAESQTQTLPLDTWEQLGVPLRNTGVHATLENAPVSPATSAPALEARQQLWRWLLWLAVALLALESLASFLVSRGAQANPADVASPG